MRVRLCVCLCVCICSEREAERSMHIYMHANTPIHQKDQTKLIFFYGRACAASSEWSLPIIWMCWMFVLCWRNHKLTSHSHKQADRKYLCNCCLSWSLWAGHLCCQVVTRFRNASTNFFCSDFIDVQGLGQFRTLVLCCGIFSLGTLVHISTFFKDRPIKLSRCFRFVYEMAMCDNQHDCLTTHT